MKAVHLCGPRACPTDPTFEHDNYFGCIPKDFSATTGRSKTHRSKRGADGRYRWDGGCDLASLALVVLARSIAWAPVPFGPESTSR